MSAYVLGFQEIDKTKLNVVGGKGANLGELARLEGVDVPPGFCISTAAFVRILAETPGVHDLIDRLSSLAVADRAEIAALSTALREAIARTAIPQDIEDEIARHLARLDAKSDGNSAHAVRSSATAEDLPGASFAGQQDTYLNVAGREPVLAHIRQCWASLFTERAVVYRQQNGFDHRKVQLAVVVQKMVFPAAAGILFTADPLTGNRKVLSIDASFGLGEALVSGLVNPDVYKVRDGKIVAKQVVAKERAIYAAKDGGTQEQEIAPAQRKRPALADAQILELARLGREIEAHFGCPQDVEWCLAGASFYIVQSRPITTLFPIPQADDQENHVYVSVGHQQMMTDPIKPLGLSFFLLTTPAPMRTAGGRLFVDVTRQFSAAASRKAVIDGLGRSDPLIGDALRTIAGREDFVKLAPTDQPAPGGRGAGQGMKWRDLAQFEHNPSLVPGLIASLQTSTSELQREIQAKSGGDLFDFILQDIQELRKLLFHLQSTAVVTEGMYAAAWLNQHMFKWLGEKNAADTLAQSVPYNITAEMGLALLDVADVIRPHPAVVAYLQQAEDDTLLQGLAGLACGAEAHAAITAFLDKYGMRCAGEIDITRPRWREKPTALLPLLLGNIKNFTDGAAKRRFEQGRQEAAQKEQDLLVRLEQLPGGQRKARETRRMIALLRSLSGYREYPKYGMVSRYFLYKQALRREAAQLVAAGVLREAEDSDYLTFEELRAAVLTHQVDLGLIDRRKEEYQHYAKLSLPRVITSDGEIVAGAYKRKHLPPGALVGLPVSSGVVEGRARVLLRMEDAALEEGDILVTPFTDPSWTPLFVAIAGLVTEVGGLMTHGAVIAREYGLPAVVGVEHATRRIADGQRIRVHGTEGYVEIL